MTIETVTNGDVTTTTAEFPDGRVVTVVQDQSTNPPTITRLLDGEEITEDRLLALGAEHPDVPYIG